MVACMHRGITGVPPSTLLPERSSDYSTYSACQGSWNQRWHIYGSRTRPAKGYVSAERRRPSHRLVSGPPHAQCTGEFILCVVYRGRPTHHLMTKGDDGVFHINKKKFSCSSTSLEEVLSSSHIMQPVVPMIMTAHVAARHTP